MESDKKIKPNDIKKLGVIDNFDFHIYQRNI